ncbi:MAG: 2Fe-2S iron-sulfur cluster-binding protein [Rhodobiaceae bacterium]
MVMPHDELTNDEGTNDGGTKPDVVFTTLALLPNGESRSLQAPAGWRLMEVLRDYGLPIRAECGGACACATCHVHVAGAGRLPLSAPEGDELDRLAEIFDADDSSRLACQILTGPQTDGLAVRLAVDSLRDDFVTGGVS